MTWCSHFFIIIIVIIINWVFNSNAVIIVYAWQLDSLRFVLFKNGGDYQRSLILHYPCFSNNDVI